MHHSETIRVGLVSDTHGLLRPEALFALRGCDRIVHAGDIGDPDILDTLAAIAPVTAVRGNNDVQSWASELPDVAMLAVGAVGILVIHDVTQLVIDPTAARFQVVVAGHSHRPAQSLRDGVLFVNPGSAGPRRFKLPVAVGYLAITGDRVTAELVELDI